MQIKSVAYSKSIKLLDVHTDPEDRAGKTVFFYRFFGLMVFWFNHGFIQIPPNPHKKKTPLRRGASGVGGGLMTRMTRLRGSYIIYDPLNSIDSKFSDDSND